MFFHYAHLCLKQIVNFKENANRLCTMIVSKFGKIVFNITAEANIFKPVSYSQASFFYLGFVLNTFMILVLFKFPLQFTVIHLIFV